MVKDNERSENHVKQLQLNDRRLTIKKNLIVSMQQYELFMHGRSLCSGSIVVNYKFV